VSGDEERRLAGAVNTMICNENGEAHTAAIHAVHAAAFPTEAEAVLVDRLRAAGRLTVSLVAIRADRIIGHIAFSPVTLVHAGEVVRCRGLGLAPIAVDPPHQRRGVGAALIHGGLGACRARGADFVVVLGEPQYYRRFGFVPASRFRLDSQYDAGDAFMAIELEENAIPIGGGVIHYAPEFEGLE